MTNYNCDVCTKTLDSSRNKSGQFTLAFDNNTNSIRVFKWPLGCNLKEFHIGDLIHLCSPVCLLNYIENNYSNMPYKGV